MSGNIRSAYARAYVIADIGPRYAYDSQVRSLIKVFAKGAKNARTEKEFDNLEPVFNAIHDRVEVLKKGRK